MLKLLQQLFFKFNCIFFGLFFLTVPFRQTLLPNFGQWGSYLFEPLVAWVAQSVLHLPSTYVTKFTSDATSLYILLAVLFFIALQFALIWQYNTKDKAHSTYLKYIFTLGLRYHLSLHLLAYGWSKVFKVQFFLAEPNTLYTPVGQLTPDILFWTTMGSAYGYTVFSGLVEVIAALLLLFRRTYILGALAAAAVLLNVVAINFGFDISVKLFSSFLLYNAFVLLFEYWKSFYQFLILRQAIQIQVTAFPFIKVKPIYYWILKLLAISLLLLNSIAPYWQAGNFNDDLAARPFLHGAYEIEKMTLNDEKQVLSTENLRAWRRVFVHRRNYFIIQNYQDQFKDFELQVNSKQHSLSLKEYSGKTHQLQFSLKQEYLYIWGSFEGRQIYIKAKTLDWKALPLVNPPFHWTIDQI